MIAVEIREEGALNVERTVISVGDSAMDFSLAWAKVYNLLLKIEQLQFGYGGRRGPNPWANLSPVTIADKRRKGLRLAKMHATEDLATAMTKRNAPHQIWKSDHFGAVFGSDLEQFQFHQGNEEGTAMPFRPPVDLTELDVQRITKIIHNHVVSGAASRQGKLLGVKATGFGIGF